MDILDDIGVSKLSAKVFFVFFKVNYSFNKKSMINLKKQDVFVLNMRKISLYNLIFKSSLATGFIMVI